MTIAVEGGLWAAGPVFVPVAVGQGLVVSVMGKDCRDTCLISAGPSFAVERQIGPCNDCIPVISYPYFVGDKFCFHAHSEASFTWCYFDAGDTDCEQPSYCTTSSGGPTFWHQQVYLDGDLISKDCTHSSAGTDYDMSYVCEQSGAYTFVVAYSYLNGPPSDPEDDCSDPTTAMCWDTESETWYACPCQTGGASQSFSVQVEELPVRWISFDKEFLFPDGKSKAAATLQNRIGTPVNWSLVGDTLGARISPSTGVITAGRTCGWILVRATEDGRFPDDPDCQRFVFERPFRIDCSACGSEGCSVGAGELRSGNFDINLSLGAADAEESAGKLWIYEKEISQALGTPATLHCSTGGSPGTQGVYVGSVLRQVLAPQTLADIRSIDSSSYQIAFYGRGDVILDPRLQDGTFDIAEGAKPRVTWRFEYREAEGLFVSKLSGDPQTVSKQYNYRVSGALREGDGLDVLREEITEWKLESDLKTRTTSVHTGSAGEGTEVYCRKDYFADFAWGESITRSILGPSDVTCLHTTDYFYYGQEDGESKVGQIRLVTNSDGSWLWYDYDNCGRVLTEISSWLDVELPSEGEPDPDSARAVYYSYGAVDQRDDPFGDNFNSPRTVTEKVLGTITAKTYHAYYVEDGKKVEVVEQCVDPASLYGDSTNLRTVTTYVAGDDKKIFSIEYPDGRLETRSYETGSFTHADYANGGDPTNAFVPGDGAGVERVDRADRLPQRRDGEPGLDRSGVRGAARPARGGGKQVGAGRERRDADLAVRVRK